MQTPLLKTEVEITLTAPTIAKIVLTVVVAFLVIHLIKNTLFNG